MSLYVLCIVGSVSEQNSIVKHVCADNWTAELAWAIREWVSCIVEVSMNITANRIHVNDWPAEFTIIVNKGNWLKFLDSGSFFKFEQMEINKNKFLIKENILFRFWKYYGCSNNDSQCVQSKETSIHHYGNVSPLYPQNSDVIVSFLWSRSWYLYLGNQGLHFSESCLNTVFAPIAIRIWRQSITRIGW